MSTYGFQRGKGETDVEGWRPLDRALYHWVRSHGGDALLARVAAWTSLADGQGDAALQLNEARQGMPALDARQLAALRASPWVATLPEHGRRPFVLDAQGRFQLWRNHAHELAIAAQVQARRAAACVPGGDPSTLDADLDVLFGADNRAAVQAQRQAVRAVPGRRLFVLTGGPGTGKTTTVLRMLLMLQRRATAPLRMRLAAPTGKAAQRLAQALREGAQALAAASLPAPWAPLLERIATTDTLTLHRLLGYRPSRNAFTRGPRDRLDADVVVVDEASMVDLDTLRHLLDALDEHACLILVGDADQLSSVATGSVLADLVTLLEGDARGDLVRLEHGFRAEPALAQLNAAVRRGDVAALRGAITRGGPLQQVAVDDARTLRAALRDWALTLASEARLRPLLRADAHGADAATAADVRAALAALAQRQLLCALREGPFGSLAANALLEARLRAAWQVDAQAPWYAGRAVIVSHNDYAAGLFNGDIGICLADDAGRLRVWFDGVAGVRAWAPRELPAHEGAFALTIHKSQGSEYAQVAVLLPPDPEHRILSRQLLYTAVSRARQSLQLWADDAVIAATLSRGLARAGALADKLARPPR